MKNDIQAKIYAETKDMSFKELKAYLNTAPSIIRSKHLPGQSTFA
jgi:hypothetical protein